LYVAVLGGCAPLSQPARLRLQLAPATFGATIRLHQHLLVERDERVDEFEAALEIDPERIDFVALAMNQRVMSIHYDGRSLESWRHPALPAEVRAEDVLQDLQLTLWPIEALRPALPAGWRIEEAGMKRILRSGDQPVAEISYSGEPRWSGKIVVNNLIYRYRLTVQTASTDR
jgi:hypothetical protein